MSEKEATAVVVAVAVVAVFLLDLSLYLYITFCFYNMCVYHSTRHSPPCVWLACCSRCSCCCCSPAAASRAPRSRRLVRALLHLVGVNETVRQVLAAAVPHHRPAVPVEALRAALRQAGKPPRVLEDGAAAALAAVAVAAPPLPPPSSRCLPLPCSSSVAVVVAFEQPLDRLGQEVGQSREHGCFCSLLRHDKPNLHS